MSKRPWLQETKKTPYQQLHGDTQDYGMIEIIGSDGVTK